jgi:nucleotide-binding universal stress UspA family protein
MSFVGATINGSRSWKVVGVVTTARVVVGLADGLAAAGTLAWAMREATSTRSQLVVVRAGVSRLEVLGAVARDSVKTLEVVEPALARAVGAARQAMGDERVGVVVDRDPAGPVLVGVAGGGDLLVVGAPSRTGWWARASTTYHVITRACCPVVVVHDPPPAFPDVGIGSFFGSHVVVGIDGSSASRAGLEFGFSYAVQHGRPLVAVTVVRRVDDDVWFDDTLFETHLASEPDAAAALSAELEPWHLKYPEVVVKRAVVGGDPADGLRRVSRGAALLVVGTAGSSITRLGSVSRALVEHAGCPVAVMRVMS